jgi:hypothetical protein
MWLEIDKKAEAIMQAAERRIRDSETAKAELEPPWDGEQLLLPAVAVAEAVICLLLINTANCMPLHLGAVVWLLIL